MNKNSSLLIAPLCITLGAAFGFFLSSLTNGGQGSAPQREPLAIEPTAADQGNADLLPVLRELTEVLSSIKTGLALQSSSSAQERRVAGAASSDKNAIANSGMRDSELAQAMAELTIALKASRIQAQGSRSATHALQIPAFVDKSRTFDTSALRAAYISGDNESEEVAERDFNNELMLKSQQQILTMFGKPSSVYVDKEGNTRWDYEIRLSGQTMEELYLKFHDGLLYDCGYSYTAE